MVFETSTETNETLAVDVVDILLEVSTIVVGTNGGGVLGRELGIIYGIMLNKKIPIKYDGYWCGLLRILVQL
jgi:hypothetical protein